MAVRFYKGDLIEDANVDIICHQTNCRGVMGARIAKQIRDTWPRVFGRYKLFCTRARVEGSPLLGTCQLVYTDEEKSRIVANLLGRGFYDRGKQQTDYKALSLIRGSSFAYHTQTRMGELQKEERQLAVLNVKRVEEVIGIVTAKHYTGIFAAEIEAEDLHQTLWVKALEAAGGWSENKPASLYVFLQKSMGNAITDILRNSIRPRGRSL